MALAAGYPNLHHIKHEYQGNSESYHHDFRLFLGNLEFGEEITWSSWQQTFASLALSVAARASTIVRVSLPSTYLSSKLTSTLQQVRVRVHELRTPLGMSTCPSWYIITTTIAYANINLIKLALCCALALSLDNHKVRNYAQCQRHSGMVNPSNLS